MPKSKTPRGRKASRSRTAAALTRKSQNKVLARSESDSDSQSSSLRPDPRPISIVGVGASAGGLEAFEQLLRGLPEDSGMGFVLVQHLAPKHESMLSELLSRATRMPVIEVTDGVAVQANYVYVIPPNADMSITDGVLHLSSINADRARRMPIDMFLRSLADDQQARAIGVILSGTASDGTLGLRAIKAVGGITFAQDDGSAKFSAMPRSAIAAGAVDYILRPDLIARELKRIAKSVHIFATEENPNAPDSASQEENLNRIYALLRDFSRIDFNYYKPGTIKRRITRRMFLRKIDNLKAYIQFLRKNPEELEALFNDLLINVTGFFRDPEAFEVLRKQAFPLVMNNKGSDALIRIWVPGCSTGEEAYSLAIAFLEYLGDRAANVQIQIFATDVSENIIQKARVGLYPESIAIDLSNERLERFFQKTESGYLISKTIRDMCVFAKQDIAKDPPFSKLDMISCRNVMIYMGPVLQKRIIPLLHYALNPDGILFLGSSETVGGFAELFNVVDKKYKIYAKKMVPAPLHFEFVPRYEAEEEQPQPKHEAVQRVDLQKLAHQTLLHRYAPPSVVVNDDLNIVQFIGQTGRFLDPTPGDASLNVLKMVKAGLQIELRVALQKARRGSPVRKEGVLVEHNGSLSAANFEILPIRNIPGNDRYYLVMFEEGTSGVAKAPKPAVKTRLDKKSGKTQRYQLEMANARLTEELEATREYLQSIIEEQRTTNEELRSANEEIQSANEELQSINEEMETAKEELQSTNEELTTVNEELQNRNDELIHLNNDLNNLLSSVNIPIIMLGNDLRIRRFTPVSEKVMNLIPADVGRPITDIKSNLKLQDLRELIIRVINSLETHETEVEDVNGRWYSMRIRPYRTIDNKIDGVVMVLLDLDARLHPNS
ncbi:MAG: chemotaxis protein CheR [Acidobacteria bacterium]|nr:MAG: chemotaxis protein CheR [Acidobacteriota bacterium]